MMRRAGGVYLAFNAVVTADVELGDGVSLWPGAVVRGDVAKVTIGAGSNVQDCAVVHCDHNMVGEECLIGADAVVVPGTVVPNRSVVMGVPGKVVRRVTDEELERTLDIARRYRELAEDYAAGRIAFPYGPPR